MGSVEDYWVGVSDLASGGGAWVWEREKEKPNSYTTDQGSPTFLNLRPMGTESYEAHPV